MALWVPLAYMWRRECIFSSNRDKWKQANWISCAYYRWAHSCAEISAACSCPSFGPSLVSSVQNAEDVQPLVVVLHIKIVCAWTLWRETTQTNMNSAVTACRLLSGHVSSFSFYFKPVAFRLLQRRKNTWNYEMLFACLCDICLSK